MTETPAHNVIEQPLSDVLSERYLSYALSTIMSRSLPDVRDGLKPVHRRLLFAMQQLTLKPNMSPKKCARVVGDVIGKYHPHGDTAVYDALVRLAQDFSVRYPLIDGQGNFGNIDGDNAAAMRYTESRMTDTAMRLLDGINEDSIDFRTTYDGDTEEPVVLPAAFPNLLANGANGIAVGMATSIPPHNAAELCEAAIALIDGDPDFEQIVDIVKGPDFPTGGVLVESCDSILQSYRTGKGAFRVRARWEKETLKGGMYQIVVTEIPYQVQKSRLVEKIADLIMSKKLPMLDDVRDESAEDIRLVLVPKTRNVEPELLMEALFRNSDLESRISLNMNVLDGGITPRVMNIKEVLQAWLIHRQEVLVRSSKFRLGKIDHRLEVLGGYLIAHLNIDDVIRIIREADDAKAELRAAFDLTDIQAEAILNMRLRSLRKLEEIEIRKEHDELSAEKAKLEALLASETKQWKTIRTQVSEIQKVYGLETELGRRRTEIGDSPTIIDVPDDIMIEKEPITVVCSEKGWIRALKGHSINPEELKYKDGDRGRFVFQCQTTDKILLFATNGRFYTLGADGLPAGRGFGEPIRLMMELENETDIVLMMPHVAGRKLLLASSDGRGFVVKEKDLIAQTKNGKQVLNVKAPVEAAISTIVDEEHDHVAVIGENRKLLVFPLADLPEMGKGKGVILQRYKDGGVSDVKTFKMETGLPFKYGSGERVEEMSLWLARRATAGRMPPNGFPRSNKFD